MKGKTMGDEENKVVTYGFTEGVLDLSVDANKDGDHVLNLKLDVNEAVEEAINKGTAIEGVSVADFKFEGSKLITEPNDWPLIAFHPGI